MSERDTRQRIESSSDLPCGSAGRLLGGRERRRKRRSLRRRRHDGWESHNLNASIRGRNLRGGGGRDWGLAALLVGAADDAAFALTWGAGMDGAGQA